jgi:hypothetical protein
MLYLFCCHCRGGFLPDSFNCLYLSDLCHFVEGVNHLALMFGGEFGEAGRLKVRTELLGFSEKVTLLLTIFEQCHLADRHFGIGLSSGSGSRQRKGFGGEAHDQEVNPASPESAVCDRQSGISIKFNYPSTRE